MLLAYVFSILPMMWCRQRIHTARASDSEAGGWVRTTIYSNYRRTIKGYVRLMSMEETGVMQLPAEKS
jgi:hypothetical protein